MDRRKWCCEQCKKWFWHRDALPAQSFKACMFGGYYGHPKKEKEIVYATYNYCVDCVIVEKF